MKAKKKPLEKKKLSDYNIEFKKRLETIQVVGMCPFFPPPAMQTTNLRQNRHPARAVEKSRTSVA